MNQIDELQWQLHCALHDIQAYRGALGYSVPGDHNGKLMDGTTPQCGMCNSEYRKNLEAKCAEMREVLCTIDRNTQAWSEYGAASVESIYRSGYICELGTFEHALSGDCGKGWIRKTAKVICLCGSTRFTDEMLVKQWELTKLGFVVLSWCALPESYFKGPHVGDAEGVKEIVDEVHKRKIDLADSVFVMNVGGYFGNSTTSEIVYAMRHGKPVEWLERPSAAELARLESLAKRNP